MKANMRVGNVRVEEWQEGRGQTAHLAPGPHATHDFLPHSGMVNVSTPFRSGQSRGVPSRIGYRDDENASLAASGIPERWHSGLPGRLRRHHTDPADLHSGTTQDCVGGIPSSLRSSGTLLGWDI
jgi:hypothetical protein